MSNEHERASEATDAPDLSGEPTDDAASAAPGRAKLLAELEMLRAENDRLREARADRLRTSYRRGAAGFALLGVLALAAALLFPALQTVFVVLGGIGLYGAVLTAYLAPDRFVAADVSERIYAAYGTHLAALSDQLGLGGTQRYVPVEEASRVRLVVQQTDAAELQADALESSLVIGDDPGTHGLSVVPIGATLFEEFEATLTGSIAETPTAVLEQLREALLEVFELATAIEIDVDTTEGRATVGVTATDWAPIDRLDHPVSSFLAAGLAIGLDQPVSVEVTAIDTDHDALVTLRWEA